MALSPDAWAAIRRAYEAGGEPVTAIAKRAGVAVGTVYSRARREAWSRRSRRQEGSRAVGGNGKKASPEARGAHVAPQARGAHVAQGADGVDGGAAQDTVAAAPMDANGTIGTPAGRSALCVADPAGSDVEAIALRLYRAINAKLSLLEARLAQGGAASAADSERETRELGSMIRSFEKVTALAAALRGRKHKGGGKAAVSAGDAERMREEIAQRLERLSREGEAAAEPGAPE